MYVEESPARHISEIKPDQISNADAGIIYDVYAKENSSAWFVAKEICPGSITGTTIRETAQQALSSEKFLDDDELAGLEIRKLVDTGDPKNRIDVVFMV